MKKPQEWYNPLEPSPNQVKAPTMKTLLNPDEQTPLSSTNSGKSMIAKANNRKLGLHLFFWRHSFIFSFLFFSSLSTSTDPTSSLGTA